MKFGKKIRSELSPELLRGTVNYKALKQIAKRLAGRSGIRGQHHHQHHPLLQQQQLRHHHQAHEQGAQEFFARLEVENEKVQQLWPAVRARVSSFPFLSKPRLGYPGSGEARIDAVLLLYRTHDKS